MDPGRGYLFAVVLALACSGCQRFSPFADSTAAGAAGTAGVNGGSSAGAAGGAAPIGGGDSGGPVSTGGGGSSGAPICPQGASEQQTRYESATVPFGQQCAAETQVRTCSGSGWSEFSGTFSELSCGVEPALACGEIGHAAVQHRVRYEAELVPFGGTCEDEIQSALCNNGVLGEWTGSYGFEECTVGAAVDCTDASNGATKERIRFATATVPFGQECSQETQMAVCDNGSFTPWSGSYTFEVCTVDAPGDCDGGAHGTSRERVRYAESSVGYGETCAQETQTQDCFNGSWSEWTGTYASLSCGVGAPADCGGVPHGESESRQRFQSDSVPFGAACVSEEQLRSCDNGVWGAWSGSYTFDVCSVGDCAEGSHESVPCGLNGRGESSRSCEGGVWSAFGSCNDPDECVDGEHDMLSCASDTGHELVTCVQGHWQTSGCGSCSGIYQDPCWQYATVEECFASPDEYDCSVWNEDIVPARCQHDNFVPTCSSFTSELDCGQASCEWTWL